MEPETSSTFRKDETSSRASLLHKRQSKSAGSEHTGKRESEVGSLRRIDTRKQGNNEQPNDQTLEEKSAKVWERVQQLVVKEADVKLRLLKARRGLKEAEDGIKQREEELKELSNQIQTKTQSLLEREHHIHMTESKLTHRQQALETHEADIRMRQTHQDLQQRQQNDTSKELQTLEQSLLCDRVSVEDLKSHIMGIQSTFTAKEDALNKKELDLKAKEESLRKISTQLKSRQLDAISLQNSAQRQQQTVDEERKAIDIRSLSLQGSEKEVSTSLAAVAKQQEETEKKLKSATDLESMLLQKASQLERRSSSLLQKQTSLDEERKALEEITRTNQDTSYQLLLRQRELDCTTNSQAATTSTQEDVAQQLRMENDRLEQLKQQLKEAEMSQARRETELTTREKLYSVRKQRILADEKQLIGHLKEIRRREQLLSRQERHILEGKPPYASGGKKLVSTQLRRATGQYLSSVVRSVGSNANNNPSLEEEASETSDMEIMESNFRKKAVQLHKLASKYELFGELDDAIWQKPRFFSPEQYLQVSLTVLLDRYLGGAGPLIKKLLSCPTSSSDGIVLWWSKIRHEFGSWRSDVLKVLMHHMNKATDILLPYEQLSNEESRNSYQTVNSQALIECSSESVKTQKGESRPSTAPMNAKVTHPLMQQKIHSVPTPLKKGNRIPLCNQTFRICDATSAKPSLCPITATSDRMGSLPSQHLVLSSPYSASPWKDSEMDNNIVGITRKVLDNGHQVGHISGKYFSGVSHRDGITTVGVTGIATRNWILFPSSILSPFADGAQSVCEGDDVDLFINNELHNISVTKIKSINNMRIRGWDKQETDNTKPEIYDGKQLLSYWNGSQENPSEKTPKMPLISWAIGTITSAIRPSSQNPIHRDTNQTTVSGNIHGNNSKIPLSGCLLKSCPYASVTNLLGPVEESVSREDFKIVNEHPHLLCTSNTVSHPGSEGGVLSLDGSVLGVIVQPPLLDNADTSHCIYVLDFKLFVSLFNISVGDIQSDIFNQNSALNVLRSEGPVFKQFVTKIQHDASWGSGISIGNRMIITNAHVVGDSNMVTVNGRLSKVKFKSQGSLDIALVECELELPSADFSKPVVGERVYSVGFSNGSGQVRPAMHSGTILAVFPSCIITSAMTIPGSSGGALINESGAVVGLLTSCFYDTCLSKIVPSIGMAVPSELILPLLKNLSVESLSKIYNIFDHSIDSIWSLSQGDNSDSLRRLSLQIKAAKSNKPIPSLPDGAPGSMLSNYILNAKL